MSAHLRGRSRAGRQVAPSWKRAVSVSPTMRVAVLGAGQAGLVAAYRLTKLGHEADVYERWPGLGGQAATIDIGDGYLVERYYHHLFTSDNDMADICAEIGVELETWPSSLSIFRNGEL